MSAFLIGGIAYYSLPRSYVQVGAEAKLYIDRSGRSRRTDQLDPITLLIAREHDGGSKTLNCEDSAIDAEVCLTPLQQVQRTSFYPLDNALV